MAEEANEIRGGGNSVMCQLNQTKINFYKQSYSSKGAIA